MFILQHYEQVTYCNHTQLIIWGIGPQGYRCQYCDFDVHKKHVYSVEEPCVGPSVDKKKRNRNSLLPSLGFAKSKDQSQLLDPFRKPIPSVSPSTSMRGPGDLAAPAAVSGSPSFRSYAKGLISTEDQVDRPSPVPSESRGSSSSGLESRPLPTPPSLAGGGGGSHQQQHHVALLNSAAQKLGAASSSDLNAGSSSRSTSSASESPWVSRIGSPPVGSGNSTAKAASVRRSESAKDGNKRDQPRPYTR